MCGRFTIVSDAVAYQLEFDIHMDETVKQDWSARYNIAPSQPVPVVKDSLARTLELMQWGLIPVWAKDEKAKMRLINVRAETIMEKVTFRKLMQQGQRCLILADGFYEWKTSDQKGGSKTPYYFHLKNEKPFVFAGLWDMGQAPGQEPITTCAIITCAPNGLMSTVHNRMPVILNTSTGWEWLSQEPTAQLFSLLKPYPENEMVAYPVSALVNNLTADAPECIQPVGQ
ncbi:MAG: SOS response-associated peptidase [Anaerolineaceae bacterium]